MTTTPRHFRDYRGLPMPLLDVAAHRRIEVRDADASLMRRAAEAAAEWVLASLGDKVRGGSVLVCAGPGNNGGDALLCALQLHRRGVAVRAVVPVRPGGGDALAAFESARQAGVPLLVDLPDDATGCAVAVDGLFGIGLRRPLGGPFEALAAALSSLRSPTRPVLALDLPSGLDADTGRPVGGGPVVAASATLAMIALKPGLFTGLGRDYTGRVWLAPLGLTDGLPHSRATSRSNAEGSGDADAAGAILNAPGLFLPSLPARRAAAHKGTFGTVAIVGGDTGTCGATLLSARAALSAGAGRVHAVMLGTGAPAYDAPHPEIMIRAADKFDWDSADALSVGAGMGRSDSARAVLGRAIETGKPAVLDADALNLLADDGALAARAAAAGDRFVLTPHPGEAARLLGTDTGTVEANRPGALRQLQQRFRCTVVLKGSGTLIGRVGAPALLNPTGNAGLASGGTGDVLGGLIGAFLAQRLSPGDAAAAAVYWHGRAAETLAERGIGPAGLTAGELAPEVRGLMNQALHERDGREGDGPLVALADADAAGSPRQAPLY
ncbi:NAD(P)H-hydrate dehydratase [Chitinasiproducens palmae]|uniref:Bifunctional NAD(P)H-hydrate repair enzyme n=1 Tax=Chitinasiproducens palmae TaxID=1770053 RepID=A0A1H2PVW2_9BURK|nr:NAD(P)H-hydrate dehydratase [Chitinasiproducens palmae]SDV51468.1 yjeF C-terminal region, hydroxyethylthiazole kinase-related/yjeF N-terminal region [Chitinasiproducens palmae]